LSTLGQKPATRHVSTEKQTITGNGGTSYTLQQSVSQASDIEVFVNNTRQEPAVAYNASGTTLTMTGAVNSSDSFYVIFQGKAIQTAGLPVDAAITASTMTLSETLSVTGATTLTGGVSGNPAFSGNVTVGGTLVNTGLITASAGVAIGGTGSANTLDDYEEGTFTPTYAGQSTAGTYNYGSQLGTYTKVGRTVTITATMSAIQTVTAGVGTANIKGLPFSVNSTHGGFGSVVLEYFDIDNNTNSLACEAVAGTTFIRFWETVDSAANSVLDVTDKTNNSADIFVTITYQTS